MAKSITEQIEEVDSCLRRELITVFMRVFIL